MMEGRPIKFRLLELFSEGEKWNYEVIKQLQSEYKDFKGDYKGNVINFNIIEIATAGFIIQRESKIDTDNVYREGSLLMKYSISTLGVEQLERLKKNLYKRRK